MARTPLLTHECIAADIGGTYVRIGSARVSCGSPWTVQLEKYREYRGADYTALVDIFIDYLSDGALPAAQCVVATAGIVQDSGLVYSSNLPWRFSADELKQRCGFHTVAVLNDFQAFAHAVAVGQYTSLAHLHGPSASSGPIVVVGAGTGLGVALILPEVASRPQVVLPSEAGQIAMAAGNDTEWALLRRLLRTQDHVPVEQLLSGPGLALIYRELCALHAVRAVCGTPEAISAAALDEGDRWACEAVDIFLGWMGSIAGDLALTFNAWGGVVLAGGVLPKLRPLLIRSPLVARFMAKGAMVPVLSRVPLDLIEHGRSGVIGAACWHALHKNTAEMPSA